jgi:hypothetical protein
LVVVEEEDEVVVVWGRGRGGGPVGEPVMLRFLIEAGPVGGGRWAIGSRGGDLGACAGTGAEGVCCAWVCVDGPAGADEGAEAEDGAGADDGTIAEPVPKAEPGTAPAAAAAAAAAATVIVAGAEAGGCCIAGCAWGC